MRKIPLVIPFLLASLSYGQSPAQDPWWEDSNRSLPQLVADGWEIFWYSGDSQSSKEYLLRHDDLPGLMQCNWVLVTGSPIRNGSTSVYPSEYIARCKALRMDGTDEDTNQ